MNILIAHLFAPSIDSAQREGALFLAAILLFALVALSALNEEVMKYVVVSSRVRDDPAFNEPVDGMIYMSTAAIGFSAGENVVYILNTYFGLIGDSTRPGVPLALINAFLVTAPLRALLSTIGHITWSGITGWFLSRHHLERGSGRMLVGGILLAAGFHTAFNLPLFLQELGLAVGWITWLVWIAGIERYLTLLGRALLASPFRRKSLEAEAERAEHREVLAAYRALRGRIDVRRDEFRPAAGRSAESLSALIDRADIDAGDAERRGELRVVDRPECRSGDRIALALLARLDLRQRVVHEDHDRDAEAETAGGLELAHRHGEAAIAAGACDAALGVRHLERKRRRGTGAP